MDSLVVELDDSGETGGRGEDAVPVFLFLVEGTKAGMSAMVKRVGEREIEGFDVLALACECGTRAGILATLRDRSEDTLVGFSSSASCVTSSKSRTGCRPSSC